ncbi:hypothetical protein AB0J72_36055 [Dactylosporangium sp. NPDC049742]|uniref:hypothetical protein n=1 Tax=Dactylosporangium sp. NPDC049742 TaxID=3154737 RepID=UPI00341A1286
MRQQEVAGGGPDAFADGVQPQVARQRTVRAIPRSAQAAWIACRSGGSATPGGDRGGPGAGLPQLVVQ